MPDSEKAVAVARDVIEQLDAIDHPYHPVIGGYFSSPALHPSYAFRYPGDLQEHLHVFQEEGCNVCAIGASVASMARLYDQVPMAIFWQPGRANNLRNLLEYVFDKETIALIECAYERTDFYSGWFYGENTPVEVYKAIAFGEQFEGHRDRMRAVMQNIVNNNGRFIPDAKP